MVSWAYYQPIFCYPHLGSIKPLTPQNFCRVPWILLHGRHTCVCTHSTLSTCSCFIAQLALKLWYCGNGKAFWNSFKKNKITIKKHQKLEGGLCSAFASVGSNAQIQQHCGLQPQKREKCSPPAFSCFFWKEVQLFF